MQKPSRRRWRGPAALVAAVALTAQVALGVPSASAVTGTITFEAFSGPSTFAAAQPAPVVLPIATISGGAVMTAVTNLPVNTSTVYGTAASCSDCIPQLTISFTRPMTSVRLQLMNGATTSESYTVVSNGVSATKVLAANEQAGSAGQVTLTGTNLRQVTISETDFDGSYTFLIDNIRYVTEDPASKADCLHGHWSYYGFHSQHECLQYLRANG
jgi:hypothetical protein